MANPLHWVIFCGVALANSVPTTALAADRSRVSEPGIETASAELARFVRRISAIDGSFPASALTIVTADQMLMMNVSGHVKSGQAVQVDANSRFYVASQTKPFVGTLAALLDGKRILPLETNLAQVWPDLKLPGNLSASQITMRDLLSHQAPLETETLNFITAYVRAIRAQEYPALLVRETKERDEGFNYSNLGYLIYAAALEASTGRSWDEWLELEVLRPLRLTQTGISTGQALPNTLVWSHQWTDHGWYAFAPKPESTRHPAGGLVSSAEDQARWMQANLGGAAPPAIRRAMPVAQRPVVEADLSDGALVCDGYGLGWYSCTYSGLKFLLATGQFVGTRSFTALFIERGFGLSFVASSDSGIERLSLEMIKGFADAINGGSSAPRLEKAAAAYPQMIEELAQKRSEQSKKAKTDSRWGGWSWSPSEHETSGLVGTFVDPAFGPLQISEKTGDLSLEVGAYRAHLQPATPGLFGAWPNWSRDPEPVSYDSICDCVTFRDRRFTRLPKTP